MGNPALDPPWNQECYEAEDRKPRNAMGFKWKVMKKEINTVDGRSTAPVDIVNIIIIYKVLYMPGG